MCPGDDVLARLPDNVLVCVFETVSRHDLCNISRLNRHYHALADAVLYKTVQFMTPELHLLFSESLSRRPRRGSAIYDIKLSYPASKLSNHHPEPHLAHDGLSRALSTMSNLERLDIDVPESLAHGIGHLFNGPFDLACLKSCKLFYQRDDDGYWDLRENIHVFAHPSLESLTIRKAKLDYQGFDLIERPHETALSKLHFIECDISDDALSDLLMFPKELTEFVLTQTQDSVNDLEESSDDIRHYFTALKSASHSLESITIDFPSLTATKPLALRDFDTLKTLRINWDYQLLGKSSKKPRLSSVGLPPELELLEFFNEFGTDEEVKDLFVDMIHNLHITSRKLTRIVVNESDKDVPIDIVEACRLQAQLKLDVIGQMEDDIDDD
ncbi:hypothetical protein S7711_06459 [Stachybotrys chartarum IBT 7711]|uniref:F-box domain-containing protein n=1 Tax=Stachybotrys chartarum (strain CBS 109288 / IBT 7711) TaxID=1280523 RepID=A0A084AX93_STACB|nr:hypothetical protein S7711_06459 [Stachybotrys chartarum IBT 7711]KFA49883.1 hypothetical protein S40293_01325 [Stachybotrys chartarum IBT 40293]